MDLIDLFDGDLPPQTSAIPSIPGFSQQLKIGLEEEVNHVFDQFFIVSAKTFERKTETSIKYCTVKESPFPPCYVRVPMFCFPEEILNDATEKDQFFTFVLTVDGKQKFGYCKRFSNIRGSNHTFECLCILSSVCMFHVMYKLLEFLEERYLVNLGAVEQLLIALRNLPISSLSEPSFKLIVHSPKASLPSEYDLSTRDTTDDNLRTAFLTLQVSSILSIFAALLFERRVIICSNNLSTVSACCHALVTLLDPFSWQHVFVPILPKDILEYCMAPMPFFIGIHSSCKQIVKTMPLEEVVFVDLEVDQYTVADGHHLPHQQTLALQQTLDKIIEDFKKNERFDPQLLRNSFKEWFIKVFGQQFLFEEGNTNIEEYLRIKFQNRGIRRFMEFFCKSQMFERFVSEQKHGTVPSNFALSTETIDYTRRERLVNSLHTLSYENKKLFQAKAAAWSHQFRRYMKEDPNPSRARLKESVARYLNVRPPLYTERRHTEDWDDISEEDTAFSESWRSDSEDYEGNNNSKPHKKEGEPETVHVINLIDLDIPTPQTTQPPKMKQDSLIDFETSPNWVDFSSPQSFDSFDTPEQGFGGQVDNFTPTFNPSDQVNSFDQGNSAEPTFTPSISQNSSTKSYF